MPRRKAWHVPKPCRQCPFLRADTAVRLTRARIREIGGMMLSRAGGEFPCHKTVRRDDDDAIVPGAEQHCAGALIFAEKAGNATQMMRIAERLGVYDAAALMADKASVDAVFDDLDEMLATALR